MKWKFDSWNFSEVIDLKRPDTLTPSPASTKNIILALSM